MDNFSKVSDILLDVVFDKKKRAASVKKATAFGFWKDICGQRFAKFSTPYEIKGKTLFVAVKNPQVMQELMFNRNSLLSKLQSYFLPLNIQIEELRYDYKVWNKITKESFIEGDNSLYYYSNEEIEEVSLDEDEKKDLSKVTNVISNLSFLDDSAKEKYRKNIVNSIKARKLRQI